jgi:hypothetical protein
VLVEDLGGVSHSHLHRLFPGKLDDVIMYPEVGNSTQTRDRLVIVQQTSR